MRLWRNVCPFNRWGMMLTLTWIKRGLKEILKTLLLLLLFARWLPHFEFQKEPLERKEEKAKQTVLLLRVAARISAPFMGKRAPAVPIDVAADAWGRLGMGCATINTRHCCNKYSILFQTLFSLSTRTLKNVAGREFFFFFFFLIFNRRHWSMSRTTR